MGILFDKLHYFFKRKKGHRKFFRMNSIFLCRRLKVVKILIFKMSKNFGARRLPPRVTPTLATPLSVWSRASSASTQPVPSSHGKKVEPSFEAPIEPCIKRPLDRSKSDASASLGEGAEPTLTSSGDKGRRTKVRKGDCFLRHWIAQLRR